MVANLLGTAVGDCKHDLMSEAYPTCMVLLLGYPGFGKRTVGTSLARLLDCVLVDNQLIHLPLLTLFSWDGKVDIPSEIWERVKPIRAAVLGTIEDLVPPSADFVFTNVIEDDADGAIEYDSYRAVAHRRGSLFLSVMLHCAEDEQVRRIDTPDRRARLKGSDPEGYRRHRRTVALFQPPPDEIIHVDTTATSPDDNARTIYDALLSRGLAR
jgi:hypothetical protein